MDRTPRQVEIIPPSGRTRSERPAGMPRSGASGVAENAVTRALRYVGLGAALVGATTIVLVFGALLSALAAAMIPLAVMAAIFFGWRFRRQIAKQGPEAYSRFTFFRRMIFPGGGAPRGDRRRQGPSFRDFFGR